MSVYKFTIPGHPVPYQRMTQAQVKLMRIPLHRLRVEAYPQVERIKRYLQYKDVCALSCSNLRFDRAPKNKVFLNVVCYFKNKAHGDPENVRKGIQDAIYRQDKMVAGTVDFFYDPDNPRVECEVVEG